MGNPEAHKNNVQDTGSWQPKNMKRHLPLLITVACLASCSSEPKAERIDEVPPINAGVIGTTDNIAVEEYEPLEILGIDNPQILQDTFVIDQTSVVFFILTQVEYDTLMHKSGKDAPDVNESLADFSYYADKTCKNLNKRGMRSDFVAYQQFIIMTKKGPQYFNRKNQNMDMGVIIFNGTKNPVIESGVFTDTDYQKMIDENLK
ncbi:MAG: hypothetical protein KF905_03610 [Flavobacteriales bacterium]|nr:hypothetical protein [Flavobacteriales bacterium]